MAIANLFKPVLLSYLENRPPDRRLARFKALTRWAWLVPTLEEIKPKLFPPVPETTNLGEIPQAAGIAPPGIAPSPTPYRQYRCGVGDPLNCPEPLKVVQQDPKAKYCLICSFPAALPAKATLYGRKGNYVVERCLGHRGMGRIYTGTQLGSEQPVVIKEYVLPQRYFNAEERKQRQDAFLNLAGLSLADGRTQDFRLVAPLEAIADDREERCYLITDVRDANASLSLAIAQIGAVPAAQVRMILNQTLQTLDFLHRQKFALPSGQVQIGFPHNNLTMHSLLLAQEPGNGATAGDRPTLDQEFFIYLTDLGLWEQLFIPANLHREPGSPAADLRALGYIAFYLLQGRVVDEVGKLLDPKVPEFWVRVDPLLKQFILRLLELDLPFESADVARRSLLSHPPAPVAVVEALPAEEVLKPRRRFPRWLIILLSVGGVLFLFGLIWYFWLRSRPAPVSESDPTLCCLEEVGAVPEGDFVYTGVEGSVWGELLEQENLPALPEPGQTLEERIAAAQPGLRLTYLPTNSVQEAIALVQEGTVDFAVIPLIDELPNGMDAQAIAYDGLAVLVAFSYANRAQSLPNALNGQISLEQLQELYTGEIRNWQQLNGSRLPVRLYVPEDPTALQVFEQRILQDDRTTRQFLQIAPSSVQQLPAFEMFRAIIQDFEGQDIGAIGFAPLSQVFGQCSVYPLAVGDRAQVPIQPLWLEQTQPINPSTDLCDRKGTYFPNDALIQSGAYPLAYPLGVIYLQDNSRAPAGEKFAELFSTDEGQRLLNQAGLVPLRPIPSDTPDQTGEEAP